MPSRLLACLLLALAVACGPPPPPRPVSATLIDHPLEPLAGGAPTSLTALAAGRPMLVDLYAVWCDGCRRQIAALEALAARVGDRAVIVGVDVGDELAAARTFASREDIDYPTFADPELRFADAMGVSDLPHLLLVDGDGAIVRRGRELDAAFERALDALIAPRSARATTLR